MISAFIIACIIVFGVRIVASWHSTTVALFDFVITAIMFCWSIVALIHHASISFA